LQREEREAEKTGKGESKTGIMNETEKSGKGGFIEKETKRIKEERKKRNEMNTCRR
jgi:hypothetical protein